MYCCIIDLKTQNFLFVTTSIVKKLDLGLGLEDGGHSSQFLVCHCGQLTIDHGSFV